MNDAVNEMCTNVLVVLSIILLCAGTAIFIPIAMMLGMFLLVIRELWILLFTETLRNKNEKERFRKAENSNK